MEEIDYDPRMGVQRMVFDVRFWESPPASESAMGTIIPLHERVWGATIAAAVASACGFSPAGVAGELACRPTRRVRGWGALSGPFDPPAPTVPLGVILLAETTAAAGGPRFSIPWLLVHPGARRLGVGRRLVAVALEEARTRGAGEVSIETLDRWPEAVAFWERAGFRPVRRRS